MSFFHSCFLNACNNVSLSQQNALHTLLYTIISVIFLEQNCNSPDILCSCSFSLSFFSFTFISLACILFSQQKLSQILLFILIFCVAALFHCSFSNCIFFSHQKMSHTLLFSFVPVILFEKKDCTPNILCNCTFSLTFFSFIFKAWMYVVFTAEKIAYFSFYLCPCYFSRIREL